jgi:NAD(P)-dependent dehydrogenase (short-subunit alcohol dehydrogenase family)
MKAKIDPSVLYRLDGRVAVVTGASSGLGMRFARVLHAAGAEVVLAARRADRIESLARELGQAVAVATDVAVPGDLSRLVSTALRRFGHIDVLVNNAGISGVISAEDEPMDHFRKVMEVNLMAKFALTQLVARAMIKQGRGSVVNVASMLGLVASGQIPQASYSASKGGLVHLTRELAVQWARKGVRVNAIAPGWFPSEMTAAMFKDERAIKWLRSRTPMGRTGEEHELDGVLLFLASDASSFVTGQVIAVDGGWVAV